MLTSLTRQLLLLLVSVLAGCHTHTASAELPAQRAEGARPGSVVEEPVDRAPRVNGGNGHPHVRVLTPTDLYVQRNQNVAEMESAASDVLTQAFRAQGQERMTMEAAMVYADLQNRCRRVLLEGEGHARGPAAADGDVFGAPAVDDPSTILRAIRAERPRTLGDAEVFARRARATVRTYAARRDAEIETLLAMDSAQADRITAAIRSQSPRSMDDALLFAQDARRTIDAYEGR